jgi:hypothetical protein
VPARGPGDLAAARARAGQSPGPRQ